MIVLGAAVDGCLKQFERSTSLLLMRGHRCVATKLIMVPTEPKKTRQQPQVELAAKAKQR